MKFFNTENEILVGAIMLITWIGNAQATSEYMDPTDPSECILCQPLDLIKIPREETMKYCPGTITDSPEYGSSSSDQLVDDVKPDPALDPSGMHHGRPTQLFSIGREVYRNMYRIFREVAKKTDMTSVKADFQKIVRYLRLSSQFLGPVEAESYLEYYEKGNLYMCWHILKREYSGHDFSFESMLEYSFDKTGALASFALPYEDVIKGCPSKLAEMEGERDTGGVASVPATSYEDGAIRFLTAGNELYKFSISLGEGGSSRQFKRQAIIPEALVQPKLLLCTSVSRDVLSFYFLIQFIYDEYRGEKKMSYLSQIHSNFVRAIAACEMVPVLHAKLLLNKMVADIICKKVNEETLRTYLDILVKGLGAVSHNKSPYMMVIHYLFGFV